MSSAFRHFKVDLCDYEVLDLRWDGIYIDMCLPFRMGHRNQVFQRLSDTICYTMRQKGLQIIDYIGVTLPSIASQSCDYFHHLMHRLKLTVSTWVTCLGVQIGNEKAIISIPDSKLKQILHTVQEWRQKTKCMKQQFQSLLGLLLFVHKCVKPAQIFLNRMLDVLHHHHNGNHIILTTDCKRDLNWFNKFIPLYNGVLLYDHKPVDFSLELDTCLTGLAGVCLYTGSCLFKINEYLMHT